MASCRRHSPFHTAPQPTPFVFCANASLSVPAPATRLKILRESWTAQAPHAHRPRQKAYSRRPTQASQPEISSLKKFKNLHARFRPLIDQLFTHVNASPTSTPPRTKTPPEWDGLPDPPPDLPPHPPTNAMNQVNTRDALLLDLMSSRRWWTAEAMIF